MEAAGQDSNEVIREVGELQRQLRSISQNDGTIGQTSLAD